MCVVECFAERTVTEAGGSLSSPNYPGAYPPSLECLWVLRAAAAGATIRLKVLNFAIEESEGCKSDEFAVGRLPDRRPFGR